MDERPFEILEIGEDVFLVWFAVVGEWQGRWFFYGGLPKKKKNKVVICGHAKLWNCPLWTKTGRCLAPAYWRVIVVQNKGRPRLARSTNGLAALNLDSQSESNVFRLAGQKVTITRRSWEQELVNYVRFFEGGHHDACHVRHYYYSKGSSLLQLFECMGLCRQVHHPLLNQTL